jgi:hypothetical protein
VKRRRVERSEEVKRRRVESEEERNPYYDL